MWPYGVFRRIPNTCHDGAIIVASRDAALIGREPPAVSGLQRASKLTVRGEGLHEATASVAMSAAQELGPR